MCTQTCSGHDHGVSDAELVTEMPTGVERRGRRQWCPFSPEKRCKIKKEWNGRRLQNEGQWRKGWPRTRIMRIGVGYDHITRPDSGHYYLASNCVMYVVGVDQVRYKKYLGITRKRRWFRRSRPSWAASNLRAFSANRRIQGSDELFDVKLQLRLATDDIDGRVAF